MDFPCCYEKLFAFTRWRTKTTSWYKLDRCHILMCDWYTGLNFYSKHASDLEDMIQRLILIHLVIEMFYYCFSCFCIYNSFNCDFILRYAKLHLKFAYKRYRHFSNFFNASKFLNFQSHADSQTKIPIPYRIKKNEFLSIITHIHYIKFYEIWLSIFSLKWIFLLTFTFLKIKTYKFDCVFLRSVDIYSSIKFASKITHHP